MKKMSLLFFIILMSCGGTLTEEQRKRIKEEMETQKIQKVSEAEITEASFAKGRSIIAVATALPDSARPDSLQVIEGRAVRYLTPSSENLSDIERQLMEAYIEAEEAGNLADNVQNVRSADGASDSILYTKPVVVKTQEGSEKLVAMWSVYLSKKELILSMKKK
jgi:hypothetical protein